MTTIVLYLDTHLNFPLRSIFYSKFRFLDTFFFFLITNRLLTRLKIYILNIIAMIEFR